MRKRRFAIAGVGLALVLCLYATQVIGGSIINGTEGVQWTIAANPEIPILVLPDASSGNALIQRYLPAGL